MTLAIITITRDRLEYTRRCFETLRDRAGSVYHHYILDNGSKDGTAGWLRERLPPWNEVVVSMPENFGIGWAWQQLARAAIPDADYILKLDNDGEIVTPLLSLLAVARVAGPEWILSPRVEGINNQPARVEQHTIAGHPVGETGMVGGLCLLAHRSVYEEYVWPTDLPPGQGWDSALCAWHRARGGRCGYVEDLVVRHMDGTDGQARKYPAYHARKMRELGREEAAKHWDAIAKEAEHDPA